MALRLFNTLSRSKEEFKSITPGKVGLYTCGPTVYNYAHIGNYRSYAFEDLLKRYLCYKGYSVKHVMNLTDIDDKTIRDSIAQKIPLNEFTAQYIKAFFEDIDTLSLDRADVYPAATGHIDEMVTMIRKLLDKGFAYEADGSIYYRISKFPDYGKLAHMDISQLKAGARVSSDEYEKEAVSDFALWKGWDENDGDVFWETEIGKGRPGWHIECSAMSCKYLGTHFDIHCGGVDNMFPHHENEIAQSVAATGDKFVNYWIHGEYLIVDGKKMSKSLGNFYTLRDILDKGYPGVAVRYLLLTTHYRMQLNFTFDGLDAARKAIERLWDFHDNVKSVKGGNDNPEVNTIITRVTRQFEDSLDDDLNISPALGGIFDFVRDINRLIAERNISEADAAKVLETIDKFDTVLAFMKRTESVLDADIENLIKKRNEARRNKDFELSDKIRDELKAQGIILEDTSSGTKWKRKL